MLSIRNKSSRTTPRRRRSWSWTDMQSSAFLRNMCFVFFMVPGITLQFLWISNKVIRIDTWCDQIDPAPVIQPQVPQEAAPLLRASTPVQEQLGDAIRSRQAVNFQDLHAHKKRENSRHGRSDKDKRIDVEKEQRRAQNRQREQQIHQGQTQQSFGSVVVDISPERRQQVTRTARPRPPQPTHYTPYHKLASSIATSISAEEAKHEVHYSYSPYSRAKKYPIPNKKLCKQTCCVEAIAISLDADEHKLTNTDDGKNLADVMISHHDNDQPHLEYHANILHPDMIPCLLPGTIIQIDNHQVAVKYFWNTLRQHVKVPFVLMTTESDDNTPCEYEEYLADPLLIAWYGTNPLRNHPDQNAGKFRPMHLGLSYQHPQSKYLEPYLQANHYTNPFTNMDRFDLNQYPLDWDQDVFVHFGLLQPHRQHLLKVLCPHVNSNSSTVSCHQETTYLSPHDIYADMSKYRFGISPKGEGWDCYRTYELLLLGVIPIIPERIPDSHQLFEGLPVIHMAELDNAQSQQDFEVAIYNYIKSPKFQNANFAAGWERLFTKHQRRQLLKDTVRDQDIIIDKNGQEFYQAYRYTTATPQKDAFCGDENSCPYEDPTKLTQWKEPKLAQSERQWLVKWLELDGEPTDNTKKE